MNFADRLIEKMKAKGSVVCVGLDPRLDKIPSHIKDKHIKKSKSPFKAAAESFIEFNKGIIDAVHELVPAVKPQIAFFEQYGSEGVRAFEETVAYAREKGLLIVADIKRGDIGSTSEAYANTYLGKVDLFGEEQTSMEVDAVTLSPYLGWDGIKPFVKVARANGKGLFILVKTSNPSSADIQDLKVEGSTSSVYEIMAQYLESWGADDVGENGYSFVGAVVGATFPQQAEKLRELMPNSVFLVPGYGAQGGTAEDVKACFDEKGFGALVNSARGIIYAWEESDSFTEETFDEAARAAVLEMNEELAKVRPG